MGEHPSILQRENGSMQVTHKGNDHSNNHFASILPFRFLHMVLSVNRGSTRITVFNSEMYSDSAADQNA